MVTGARIAFGAVAACVISTRGNCCHNNIVMQECNIDSCRCCAVVEHLDALGT